MHRLTLLLLVTAGCLLGSPPLQDATSDGTSTGPAMPASTSTSTSAGTSTSDTPHPTSTGEPDSSTGHVFIPSMDVPSDQCDGFMQDCPAGQKCMPYIDDEGGWWNKTKCVPVVEDPAGVGEPCFAPEGGGGGVDDCELGAMCWDVDAKNMGVCFALCIWHDDYPVCPQGSCASFTRGGGAMAGICIPYCDPLAQDCDPSDVCIPDPSGTGFLCVLDASGREGQLHDPCMYANACDPGLYCADVAAAKECDPRAQGCCEPFCDLTAPNTCPGEDQVCVTIYEGEPLAGFENVGYCSVVAP